MSAAPRVRRTRLREKYGLPSGKTAAAPAASTSAAAIPVTASGGAGSLPRDGTASVASSVPASESTVAGEAVAQPTREKQSDTDVLEAVTSQDLTPSQCKVAAALLCLDLDAAIPEPLLVAVALGRTISDRQQAAADHGTECADEPIAWGDTRQCYSELVQTPLRGLFSVLDAQVPALAEWAAASGCVFRADPAVVTALLSRPDIATGDGPMWDALDALFALCGTWSSETAQSASGTELHNVTALVPHLRKVAGALWKSKHRPSNRLLVQELAMTMFSTAICEAAAAKDMSIGKEWCEHALEVWHEAATGDEAVHSDFEVKVTHHLGNQLLMLRKPDDALEFHSRCLEAKKALEYPSSSLAVTHHQLGNVYCQLGRWNKAIRMYKEADRMKSADDSVDVMSRALTIGCLSAAHEQRGGLQAAADAAAQQLDLLRDAHASNLSHPSITGCLRRLMELRKRLKASKES